MLSILILCHIRLTLSPVCHFSFISIYDVFCNVIHLSFYVVKSVLFFIITAFDVKVLKRLSQSKIIKTCTYISFSCFYGFTLFFM